MDFEQLLYAYTIYKQTTITSAARKLSISQPNMSKKLSDLEEALGYKLFYRNYKCMEITSKGKIFIDKISPTIEKYLEFNKKYSKTQKQSYNIASNHVYLCIDELINSLPKLNLETCSLNFSLLNSINIMDKILSNDIDLGIIVTSSTEYKIIKKFCDLNSINLDVLHTCDVCAHVLQNSIFYNRESISREELKGKTFVKIINCYGNLNSDLVYLNSDDTNRTIFVNDMYEALVTLKIDDSYALGGSIYKNALSRFDVKPVPIYDSGLDLYGLCLYRPDLTLKKISNQIKALIDEQHN